MRWILCAGLLAISGCNNPFDTKDWDREYVLYDSAESRRRWNEHEQLRQERDELAAELAKRDASVRPEEVATAPAAKDPVARIFELQSTVAELDRAIADGLDPDGLAAARRAGIRAEIEALIERHRAAYEAEREARLERLTGR
ncbi:MAG: hypothetical protein KDB80_06365 [Planctomycetes bacterium]|nr:hypothetical protein [Planctomycetota bacterium]